MHNGNNDDLPKIVALGQFLEKQPQINFGYFPYYLKNKLSHFIWY